MIRSHSPSLSSLAGQAGLRAHEPQKAIIDIGSNTVRMVIYGGPARAPQVLFNEKVTARLGKGVAESGRLGAKGQALALAALRRFALLLGLRGVDDVECVATAAARDAENGPEFLAQVGALGLAPRLLSGEEEAIASARGVLSAFPGAQGLVADLGGGSLELIDIAADTCTHGVSLPLGTLRLPALRVDGGQKFGRRVAKMLRGADWAAHPGQTLYLVGGSLRAFARYAMEAQNWPIDDPHGFELSPADALAMARSLADTVQAGRVVAPIPGISASRLASLPDAGALLGVLVRELEPERLVFSGWGLREGLLAAGMDADTAAQDPLLAGVARFVDEQHAGFSSAGVKMAGWTAAVAGNARGAAQPLRLAATMLALASLTTEPNVRAQQAAQWALRKRWLGLDAGGRAMLAMAVLANSGQMAVPPELLRLAPHEALRQAASWGLATRLARRLCGGAVDVLARCGLAMEGGMLVLHLPEDLAPLYTDTAAKDLRNLANWLELTPHCTGAPQ